jgi:hypothetical protein
LPCVQALDALETISRGSALRRFRCPRLPNTGGLPPSKPAMKTLASQFIALRTNLRTAATLPSRPRRTTTVAAAARAGRPKPESSSTGPAAARSAARPARQTGPPPPATSGGSIPPSGKPHDTDGERRAEPAKPDPTTLTPRPAPRAPVDPHNTDRVPGYSPAGPGFRDAHSIMVAAPGPEGKTQHAHSPAATAAGVRMAAGRAVRRAPNRTRPSREQAHQERQQHRR